MDVGGRITSGTVIETTVLRMKWFPMSTNLGINGVRQKFPLIFETIGI